MFLRYLSGTHLIKFLFTIGLLLLLCGCGNNTTGQGNNVVTPTVPLTSPTVSSSILSFPPDPKVNIYADSMHIETTTGFYINGCSADTFSKTNGALVLAQNRLNYTSEEIQQMQAYMNALADYNPSVSQLDPTMPSTLTQIPGNLIGHIDGWNMQNWQQNGCMQNLQIINEGDTPIQLSQVSGQLVSVPQHNDTHYRLINVCMQNTKLDKAGPPLCPNRPSASLLLYQADFSLGMADTNTEFQALLHPIESAPASSQGPVTLQPQDTLYLLFNFTSSSNLVYAIAPKLTLDVLGEQRQIVLPTYTLAFATANQFSCYELQGTSFVALTQVITMDQQQAAYDNKWCL